jgi:hypothetical protein
LNDMKEAYDRETLLSSQVEISSMEAMRVAMNDELINQEIILSKKFRKEYEEKLEFKLDQMQSELERVHNVDIMERKTREEQLQRALQRAQLITSENEAEHNEILNKLKQKEKETLNWANSEIKKIKQENEEMEFLHKEKLKKLESEWAEERSILVTQCEDILTKAKLADARLKRQQDLTRSSRESSLLGFSGSNNNYSSSSHHHHGTQHHS